MQKFEHFGAKIKNRPKSSLRTFLHGALQIEVLLFRQDNEAELVVNKIYDDMHAQ